MLFISISSGRVQTFNELSAGCFTISKKSQNKFSPDFDEKNYLEQYHTIIRYHIKGVRICGEPFSRIDSEKCLMWHQLAKNACVEEKMLFGVLCRECKCLQHHLEHQNADLKLVHQGELPGSNHLHPSTSSTCHQPV